jgi:hypothetical protein
MTAAPEIAGCDTLRRGFIPMRFVALILVVVSALSTQLAAQENPTLSVVLEEHSIPFPPSSIPHLNTKITSLAVLDDDLEFVIAYYVDKPKNELRAPLPLTRYNKITGNWDYMPYSESQLKVSDISDISDNSGIPCLGSVVCKKMRSGIS